MRIHVVDPSAYTPPYDHALCRALGAAGVDVELFTSRFAYGAVAPPVGYRRRELFYRRAHRGAVAGRRSRARLALKLAEHVPDMLRYSRAARAAAVVHFQWLTVQPLDTHLLPRSRPTVAGGRPKLVLTAHDVLPREPRLGQLAAQRRLYERVDAVVVHSEHGRRRLVGELDVAAERVHVIPHGVLRPWEGVGAGSLPPELCGAAGPVALFFGLLRPYKGLDVLLEAWHGLGGAAQTGESRLGRDGTGSAGEPRLGRDGTGSAGEPRLGRDGTGSAGEPRLGGNDSGLAGAELWIVGMPRMDIAPLLAAADGGTRMGGGRVRVLPRFVSDAEVHAVLRRASLVVAPYREIDQSGVVATALGAGAPLLLSDVGGFPEVAATGAARTVPVGDAAALRGALRELLGDPAALAELAAGGAAAAAGPYSWEAIARAHVELYERLLAS